MRNKNNPLPDEQRLSLINELLNQWSITKYFPVRKMRQALTADEWTQYQDQLTQQRPPPMPLEITRAFQSYTASLRRADNLDYRSSRTPGDARRACAFIGLYPKRPLHQRAAIEYLRAQEILEEIFEDFPGARVWMDRPVYFDQKRGFDASVDGMPRLLSSRSPHALRNDQPRSRRGMAFDALIASRVRTMEEMAQTQAATAALTVGKHGYRGIGSLKVIFDPDEI